MIIKKRTILLMLAAAGVLAAPAAMAADYEPPVVGDVFVQDAPADEYVPVEVGSGWYLRGDVSYNFKKDFKRSSILANDFIADSALMPYSLGAIGLLDVYSNRDDENPVSGSIGFGYHFNDYLRADVNIGILSSSKDEMTGHLWSGGADGQQYPWHATNSPVPDVGCSGTRTVVERGVSDSQNWRRDCDVSGSASNKMYDGMVNAYVDLGTFAGFTPYVGAGVGMLYSRTKLTAYGNCWNGTVDKGNGNSASFGCNGTPRADGSYQQLAQKIDDTTYNLMYGLNAGVAYNFTQNVALDVGYAYKSAPNVEYLAISQDGFEKRKGFDSHALKVGLRYDLW